LIQDYLPEWFKSAKTKAILERIWGERQWAALQNEERCGFTTTTTS
jgi:hypothetical protein